MLITLLFFFLNLFAVPGLSFGIWDLVPWPGIKPEPPVLGAQSLSHSTKRSPYFILYFQVIDWHSKKKKKFSIS